MKMFKRAKFLIILSSALLALGCNNIDQGLKKDEIEGQSKKINELIVKASLLSSEEDSILQALDLFKEAHSEAKKIGNNELILETAYQLGSIYTSFSKPELATGMYYTSLKYAEVLKDSQKIAQSKLGLGIVMYTMNRNTEAVKYFKESLDLNNQIRQVTSHKNLHFYLLGLGYARLNKDKKAFYYLEKSKKISQELNDTMKLLEIRLGLNNIKIKNSDNSEILKEYQELYQIFNEKSEKVGKAYTLEGMGKYYLKKEQNLLAQEYANQSYQEVKNLNLIYPLQSILETVVEAELKNKNFEAASQHLRELQAIKDSIQGLNTAAKVTLLTADYDFSKKKEEFNSQMQKQRKQNLIWISVAGLLFTFILLFVYFLRVVSKERKKSDALLLNILPKDTAKDLKIHGKSEAKTHRSVTIVFADIENFTSIARGLPPNVIVMMLDRYFQAFDDIIEKYSLEKIKTIGDAYMFVAGLKGSSKESAVNAVEACQELIEETKKIYTSMRANYGVAFKFRFGMNTGDLVSGVVGKKKYAFDVWGDAVNLASRMESASTPNKLNISETTYHLVQDQFKCTPRGELNAKNRGKIKMYFVDFV
jgi:class 3 adenylate cyclase/tetratricopeptide (TPR) repeat protein